MCVLPGVKGSGNGLFQSSNSGFQDFFAVSGVSQWREEGHKTRALYRIINPQLHYKYSELFGEVC